MSARLMAHIFLSRSRTGSLVEHDFMFKLHLLEKIHRCSFWWTPHHCSWPKPWAIPPTKLGSRTGWENEVGKVKQKFYTHNFVSFPPTHLMCLIDKRCTETFIDFISFFWPHNVTCIVSEVKRVSWDVYKRIVCVFIDSVWFHHFFLKRRSFIAVH